MFLLVFLWPYIKGEIVRKRLGKPCKVTNYRVQYYLSRSDLDFEDIVGVAKKEIIFVSITHEIAAPDNSRIIRNAIVTNNVNVRVLILNPDSSEHVKHSSEHVKHQERVFGLGESPRNLKSRTEEALQQLCTFKSQLPEDKRENLQIQTYNSNIAYSLMIIDHNSENACLKIEEHPLYSTEASRANKVVFYKDNPSYYTDYFRTFENLSLDGDNPCQRRSNLSVRC